MRKSFLLLCLVLMLTFSSTLTAWACWMAPEPFEIVSEDGSRVFVFIPIPDAYGFDITHAALYEIAGDERRLIYTVQDLSSFAYESNFHFSADMMHFARVFPPHGMNAFEVFSYGERTRVVMRSDFIDDYATYEVLTSVGPMYAVTWRAVTWRIEESPQGAAIKINTDEDSAILFDLATATFAWEDVLPAQYKPLPGVYAYFISGTQNSPVAIDVTPPDVSSNPISHAQNPPILIFAIASGVLALIAGGVFLLKRQK